MSRRRRAFTLIELTIALAVGAVILAAICKANVIMVRRHDVNTSYSVAVHRANAAMEAMCRELANADAFSSDTEGITGNPLYTFTFPDATDAGTGSYIPDRTGSSLMYGYGARVRFYLSDATGAESVAGGTVLWRETYDAVNAVWNADTVWSRNEAGVARYSGATAFTIAPDGSYGNTVRISLTVQAGEGAQSRSYTITRAVFLKNEGVRGRLSYSLDNVGNVATVNLTTEGASDWAHWGLSTQYSYNHSASGGSQISNVSVYGGVQVRDTADSRHFTWTNGLTGTGRAASATGTATGIRVGGAGNGLYFSAPADRTVRTLRAYVAAKEGIGTFYASLSDAGAPDITDSSLNSGGAAGAAMYGVYTITYQATKAGQYLYVYYWEASEYFNDGNQGARLQAATLY